MAQTFTREAFYELVWSKPLTHLAREFAISDVALHKICRKHDIPNPPLGWWARKAAGKEVTQIPLPEAPPGSAGQITIASPDLRREPSGLSEVREQARIAAAVASASSGGPPHPIVEHTLAALRKSKSTDTGLVSSEGSGLIRCEVSSVSVDRLATCLPQIVSAAALQGFDLVAGEKAAQFRSPQESVSFSITETIAREKHVPTPEEEAKLASWERKRNRARQRGEWEQFIFDRPGIPEWDFRPTGQLSFEFEQVYVYQGSAPRRSFRDARVQRLENLASEIAVGLAVLAAAKTAERQRYEAIQRQREEESRRRQLEARHKFIEERRAAGLGVILSEIEELTRLRQLIARLQEEVASDPTPRLSEFLTWARQHLDHRQARLSAPVLEERFAAQHLFGSDDDHGFPSYRTY